MFLALSRFRVVTDEGMKGRQVRLVFWLRDSVVNAVSSSKMPAGRLLRLLLVRDSVVRPVSLSKTLADRLLRLLPVRVSVVSAVRSSNTPAGRLLTPVPVRVSDVKPVRSTKSSDFNVVRVDLLEMDRVVIPARCVVVTLAQADMPDTAATMASRTSVVRVQTSVAGTVTDTLPALALP